MALKRQAITDAVKQEFTGRGLSTQAAENPGSMETFSIRLTARDRATLEQHFKRRGLRLSPGLRMIITDYMIQNNLK